MMEHNNTGDDMIEIIPDVVPEEDHDIKISDPQETVGEEPDIKIAEDTAAVDEDDDIRIAEPAGTGAEYGNAAPVTVSEFAEDDFSEELEEIDQEQQDFEIMEEIGDSIINQVDSENWAELQNEDETGKGTGEEYREDEPAEAGNPVAAFFAKIPKWGYVVIGCAFVVTVFLLWLTMSSAGQGILIKLGSRYIAGKVNYQPVEEVEGIEYLGSADEDLEYNKITGEIHDLPDDFEVVTPEVSPEPEPVLEEKSVYNILLIGEENIDSGSSRGRSDLIMIASLNVEQKTVKLTSVMRDSLVSIPNHLDNRINAAYMMGGVSLLYDTMKTNLGIEFDNYCLVNFESFERIVDAIGGVDISLSAEEAEYLNTTNYISKPQYRTVKEGMNHLNGNQALGYCRIRKVPTSDLQYGDIGRTSRQRRLMRSIFESVSRMSNIEMMNFADNCMIYVTTDLTQEEIEQFMLIMASMLPLRLEEFRIPVEGSYSDVKLRGMLVTQIDLKTNTEALRKFIYGQ